MDRRRAFAVPDQIGVAVVLEDRNAILLGELQELETPLLGHDGAGRVLYRRDGVDIFRRDPAAFEVAERIGECIHPHPAAVERNTDRFDPEPRQPGQRALIGFALYDHGIAAGKQSGVDEVERLQRTRDNQDVVGGAGDVAIALEFRREKLTQCEIALRAACQPVRRECLAFALQHGVNRTDQAIEWDLLGVNVAADEAVFGMPRPS